MRAKGILVVYAACTKDCALFVPNRLSEGGTCGLSKEPTNILKGSLN
jgi:hypothetical protein